MKIVVKFILLIILLLIGIIADSAAPVITNELAMTQLENSNELLIATSTYSHLRSVIGIAYGVIICLVAFSLARDLIKFSKST